MVVPQQVMLPIKEETESTISTKLIQGKTTKAEVRTLFGPPLSTTFTDAGNEIYKYSFSKTQANASNFIPIIGIFHVRCAWYSREKPDHHV